MGYVFKLTWNDERLRWPSCSYRVVDPRTSGTLKMAGLNLNMNMGGVGATAPPTYGNAGTSSVMAAAFGPGATSPVESQKGGLHPSTPVGLSTMVGIGAVIALVAIRQSLPQ